MCNREARDGRGVRNHGQSGFFLALLHTFALFFEGRLVHDLVSFLGGDFDGFSPLNLLCASKSAPRRSDQQRG